MNEYEFKISYDDGYKIEIGDFFDYDDPEAKFQLTRFIIEILRISGKVEVISHKQITTHLNALQKKLLSLQEGR